VNIDEFFERLALTKNKYVWRTKYTISASYWHPIRTNADDDEVIELCPVTAVHAFEGLGELHVDEYMRAGDELGLPTWLCKLIVAAADDNKSEVANEPNTVKTIRARMLEVLGL
jgi:hypothetical protein